MKVGDLIHPRHPCMCKPPNQNRCHAYENESKWLAGLGSGSPSEGRCPAQVSPAAAQRALGAHAGLSETSLLPPPCMHICTPRMGTTQPPGLQSAETGQHMRKLKGQWLHGALLGTLLRLRHVILHMECRLVQTSSSCQWRHASPIQTVLHWTKSAAITKKHHRES